MTPIEKNIIVVDELGNRYEDTYIKRAKGLVKHGRARFVDDHTICLACPPTTELEDKIMSENLNINTSAETVQETVNVPEQPIANTRYTIEYCLEQMELITLQSEHLMQAMEELKSIESVVGGDGAGSSKARAICEIAKAREETNQRLIAFYEKVYDDLKPVKTVDPVSEVLSHVHGDSKSSTDAQAVLINNLISQMSNPMLDKETKDLIRDSIKNAMTYLFL